MKKINVLLFSLISLLILMLAGCVTKPDSMFTVTEQRSVMKNDDPNWNDWCEENKNAEDEYVYYIYWIKTAPKEYKKFVDTDLWYFTSEGGAGNQFLKQQLEKVEEKLNSKKFKTFYAKWYNEDRIGLNEPLGLEK